MKRINKNIIVFIIAFVFIFLGFGGTFIFKMEGSLYKLYCDLRSGNLGGVVDFISRVDNDSSVNLSYHDILMDMDSAKQRLFGTKTVKKDKDTYIVTDSGYLVKKLDYISDESLDSIVSNIKELYDVSLSNDCGFLYVATSSKSAAYTFPSVLQDYSKENYDRFVEKLNNNHIPTLNMVEKLTSINMFNEQTFFITDHHWTPNVGFLANSEICKSLNEKYGFLYDEEYTNLENYTVETYKDWFLGSYGKKTGRFFVPEGAEDINLITPKFETNLTVEQPYKNSVAKGSFMETVINMDFLKNKDFYGINAYAAYTGGDFQYQIVRNNLNKSGSKILVIRDSCAAVVTPFLAMNASELHILDLRDFTRVSDNGINVFDYIESTKPDYVVVLYNGVTDITISDGLYDFG